jgi:hypothetical protein
MWYFMNYARLDRRVSQLTADASTRTNIRISPFDGRRAKVITLNSCPITSIRDLCGTGGVKRVSFGSRHATPFLPGSADPRVRTFRQFLQLQ